ncbi:MULTISPECIES: hypothetical protein [unclassified Legionella]|uniref:endonuclease/exonuclease/phosphatase family protein n=1 Tax=unclassified Legionella TaxID=2622702 RepID=UPI0010541D53|nr:MULTISPECIES: hypothetical protein [unclassified Legionella]MDI9817973.1 hypothetical protein [Legionella sp. PL877]
MSRKHPLFPTYEEVKKNPDLARSDHLPVLSKVPLGEQESLNIVSLNILGGEGCSGVHPRRMEIPEGHTLFRYQQIASGLGYSIKKHQVDVILLQEANQAIVPCLEEVLGNDWDIIIDRFGVISCYNKKRLQLQQSAEDEISRIRSMTFTDKKSGFSIDVHNIWGNYSPFPHYMEEQYHSVLTKTESDISVIMGDTNSRLAPPADHRKKNLTTGIVPPVIAAANGLSDEIQITDHPDGGFYRDNSGSIHQLSIETLDFDTAEIVIDERNEAEADVWQEYRMVMCLDDYYQKTAIIDGKTIFDYENSLKEGFGDETLVVRMASDSYNNKAIAIRFPNRSPVIAAIKREFDDFQFETINSTDPREGGQLFCCVFAPVDKIDLLHQALQTAMLKHQVAQKINTETSRLSVRRWYLRDASEKIASLNALKDQITNTPAKSTKKDILQIIKNWENEEPSSTVLSDKIKNNNQLMDVHRNILPFFSPKFTKTHDTLQSLKEELGDKPGIEAKM